MEFNIPVILLKELVILPGQEAKIAVNNDISGSTINEASSKYKGEVLVVAPIDALEEEPSVDDLPSVGVVAKIKNKLDDGGQIYVRLKGIKRVVVQKYYQEKNKTILYSRVKDIDVVEIEKPEMEALKDKLFKVLKEYVDREKGVSNDIISLVSSEESFEKITDLIAAFLPFNTNKKLWYMQEVSADARAKSLIKDVNNAVVAARLDEELEEKVDERLQNDQRMYLLKEKMKVLKEELDEKSWKDEEVLEYKKILGKLKINKGIKEHLNREIEKYKIMADTAPEISVMHNYLETVLKLPWNKESKENANFVEVHKALDKSHFGLDTIKKRISEYVAIKNLNKNILPPIICLIGPPGVGKTSIASSIAKALNREFYKISVGGLNDSTELIGTRRTYLASSPGKIIQGINKCGVNNPLILIDEVDVEQNHGSIIPDVAVYAGGKKFFVEIYVTHAVDVEKLSKLKQSGISTIEIDLSKADRYIQAADLSEVLLGSSENKKWIFNTQVDKYYQAFLQVSEKRRISHKGHVAYTDFCPRKLHWVNGKPCASQLDDCFNCDYQFEVGDDYVLCMGRSLVTSIDDLKKSRKERRPCRTSPVNFKTMADAKLWICPDCGYPLHRVEGKNGSFIGCSNYPWCNFTMPDNSK